VRVGQDSRVDEWRGGHGHDRFSPEEAPVEHDEGRTGRAGLASLPRRLARMAG
jgi:hypothetical protein